MIELANIFISNKKKYKSKIRVFLYTACSPKKSRLVSNSFKIIIRKLFSHIYDTQKKIHVLKSELLAFKNTNEYFWKSGKNNKQQ